MTGMNSLNMMKKLIFACIAAFAFFSSAYAMKDPDATGSKLVTVQAGGFPGFGGLLSGQIALSHIGQGHLYGGFQIGGNYRHGAVLDTRMMDLSFAPRVLYGFNLGRVVELHAGGLAGIDVRRLDSLNSQLVFCYGGFGGLRLHLNESFGFVLEGCYSNTFPYATAGLAIRF